MRVALNRLWAARTAAEHDLEELATAEHLLHHHPVVRLREDGLDRHDLPAPAING
jgi:hypothetical protein